MPRLSDDQRASVNARLALHERIRESFKGREWRSVHCYLCNWASNGRTFEEAQANDERHKQENHAAEDAEMKATEIPLPELRDSLHDHECVRERCICICGCREGPFCTLIFGPLCSVCTVRDGRGDKEHGKLRPGT